MSRLWRDQIQIFFAPGRIDFVRSSRGLKPVQAPRVTKLCGSHNTNPPPNQPIWEQPMRQLEQMLQDAAGAALTITLSNHFVRYVTLPPQAEITTPDEINVYAAFRMREIYAERVDAWALSVSAWNPLEGAICAAMSRDLLEEFEAVAAKYKVKLQGVEPYFASVYDRWYKTLQSNTQLCFVLVESGRICIALLDNGIWQSVRNQHVLHDIKNELFVAIDQEIILSGNKETPQKIYLFAPEHPELVLPENCGWHVVSLQTAQIPILPHYPSAIDGQTETNECVA
ncbi:MAG: hypothetical protein OEX11_02985 [Nitrosomonas sp.]|nr:hypothetical protein [Nitrosomonas sp.]